MNLSYMKRLPVLMILLSVSALSLYANPYVNINAYAHFHFDKSGLAGISVQWVFDPLYSSQIIYECDLDSDGVFSRDEIAEVKDYYFSHLDQYNYYLDLAVNRRKITFPDPVDFNARVEQDDEVVIFTFYIPFRQDYTPGGTRLMVDFVDPSDNTAFICDQRSLSIKGEPEKIKDVVINRLGSIEFTFGINHL